MPVEDRKVNLLVIHCRLRTESLLQHAARLTLLVVALSPAVLYAQGGPPMLTDDPDTPGSGNWEINLAYIEERNRLERFRSVPHVDVNYGLGSESSLSTRLDGYMQMWRTAGPEAVWMIRAWE